MAPKLPPSLDVGKASKPTKRVPADSSRGGGRAAPADSSRGVKVSHRAQPKRKLQQDVATASSAGRLSSLMKLDATLSESVPAQLTQLLSEHSIKLIDLFREWDEDNSGTIDKQEFYRAVSALGYHASRQDIDRAFDLLDADGGGTIDYQEMKLALIKARKPAPPPSGGGGGMVTRGAARAGRVSRETPGGSQSLVSTLPLRPASELVGLAEAAIAKALQFENKASEMVGMTLETKLGLKLLAHPELSTLSWANRKDRDFITKNEFRVRVRKLVNEQDATRDAKVIDKLFDTFDHDRNGALDPAELTEAFARFEAAYAAEASECDAFKSQAEQQRRIAARAQRAAEATKAADAAAEGLAAFKSKKSVGARLGSVFLASNASKIPEIVIQWGGEDRLIDLVEWRENITNLGLHAEVEEIDALFLRLDADGGGTLDMEEVTRALTLFRDEARDYDSRVARLKKTSATLKKVAQKSQAEVFVGRESRNGQTKARGGATALGASRAASGGGYGAGGGSSSLLAQHQPVPLGWATITWSAAWSDLVSIGAGISVLRSQRLLRATAALDSPIVGRLSAGSRVSVLEQVGQLASGKSRCQLGTASAQHLLSLGFNHGSGLTLSVAHVRRERGLDEADDDADEAAAAASALRAQIRQERLKAVAAKRAETERRAQKKAEEVRSFKSAIAA